MNDDAKVGMVVLAREIGLLIDEGEVTFSERGRTRYADFLADSLSDDEP